MRWRLPEFARLRRPRLLPLVILAASGLLLVKGQALLGGHARGPAGAIAAEPPAPRPPAPPSPMTVSGEIAADPAQAAAQAAERQLLGDLRARREELDRRDAAIAAREAVLTVAERRLGERIAALTDQNRRLEAAERMRAEREDGAWRSLVKTYEGMRPASAASILEELEMPVLVQIMDRMGERRAGPILAAMRPDRARSVTNELARHRTARPPA